VRIVRGSITDSPIFRGGALLVRSAFSDSPRVVAGRSATPSRTVRRSHTDSPPRLLLFRACASVLVCLLPLLVPRLLGGSFEVVRALFGVLFVCVGSWSCDWGIGRIQPKGRIFIGSHSLPPLWSPESVLQTLTLMCGTVSLATMFSEPASHTLAVGSGRAGDGYLF
jgi:hypothetical protein